MKKNFIFSRVLAALLALICMLSMTLAFVSCSNDGSGSESSTPVSTPNQEIESPEDAKITITLEVIGPDNSSKEFVISTSKKNNLRQALEAEGLISGDESAYGLYVKVVNGITADYDVDSSWWSLSKGGEILMTGVDSTPIADGDHFELTYSK